MGKRAYSPRDISAKTYKLLPWGEPWLGPFGAPERTSTWFVCGKSASGKSSFVMQLAKRLCEFGTVLYVSYEEGVTLPFHERMARFKMNEVQGKFRVITDDSYEELMERLAKPKAPMFVVIDSFQYAGWTYQQAFDLVQRFKRKSFIFVSQEAKGQPLGKAAVRLRYMADVKVWVAGFKAYCQGRFNGDPGTYYPVWKEGILRTTNNL